MMHRGKEPILSPVLFPRISGSADKYFKECPVLMKDLHVLFPWLKFPSVPPVLQLTLGFYMLFNSASMQEAWSPSNWLNSVEAKKTYHLRTMSNACSVWLLHSCHLTISNFYIFMYWFIYRFPYNLQSIWNLLQNTWLERTYSMGRQWLCRWRLLPNLMTWVGSPGIHKLERENQFLQIIIWHPEANFGVGLYTGVSTLKQLLLYKRKPNEGSLRGWKRLCLSLQEWRCNKTAVRKALYLQHNWTYFYVGFYSVFCLDQVTTQEPGKQWIPG